MLTLSGPGRSLRLAVASFLVVGGWLGASSARADTVSAGGIAYKDAQITGVNGNELIFKTASGSESHKAIDSRLTIDVTGDTALSTAEAAYAAQKWPDAAQAYLKSMNAPSKPWIKDWSALRLVESAGKANQFDVAVKGWIVIALRDADFASHNRPTLPTDKTSTFLVTASNDVKSAADSARTDAQKIAFWKFYSDLAAARGDDAAADAAMTELGKLQPGDAGQMAAVKLLKIRRALEAKNYADVIKGIEADKATFVDAPQQSDAFYYRAEAQSGLLPADANVNQLSDVVLDYMRSYVALPASPHSPDALLKAAALQIRLKAPEEAVSAYERIARDGGDKGPGAEARKALEKMTQDFAGQPAGAAAKTALDRLAQRPAPSATEAVH